MTDFHQLLREMRVCAWETYVGGVEEENPDTNWKNPMSAAIYWKSIYARLSDLPIVFFITWLEIFAYIQKSSRDFPELKLDLVSVPQTFNCSTQISVSLVFHFTNLLDGVKTNKDLTVEIPITPTSDVSTVAPTISSPKLLPIPYKPAHESLRQ